MKEFFPTTLLRRDGLRSPASDQGLGSAGKHPVAEVDVSMSDFAVDSLAVAADPPLTGT